MRPPHRLPLALVLCLLGSLAPAEPPRQLALAADDVIPTGNEWIALPTIRAGDGALLNFNVLAMRNRGLLQVAGREGQPVIALRFRIDGTVWPFRRPTWELIESWIPTGRLEADGIHASVTYCAPPERRGAFVRLTVTNRRAEPVKAELGLDAVWGSLSRVTYVPVALRGERTIAPAPWVSPGVVFAFVTHDTEFAWALIHRGADGEWKAPPAAPDPALATQRTVTVAPGETAEANFILGVGVEEFSAAHAARVIAELLDREGSAGLIERAAGWCRSRTRTTGDAELDALMNRNFLFNARYAWGRTLDTEAFVGVTSRSPRYYVSAAYWDRDALLWSFPALLDIDVAMAREALQYALTTQLRNAGTHSRFIDGVVLEDGFQLDAAVAPILALAAYVARTGDQPFLEEHRGAVVRLRERLFERHDPASGLYTTLQDAQDEYQKYPFSTYDNALAWRAVGDLARLAEREGDQAAARELGRRAEALRTAVLRLAVAGGAPGAAEPILVCSTDGAGGHVFADVPPGSLLKLPALGFLAEDDALFAATYDWLHSSAHRYAFADEPFGLPGSYRVPFTTAWSVADHLRLARSRDRARRILTTAGWDGGIISEGINPRTGQADQNGRAFATAAGYVAHAIYEAFGQPERARQSSVDGEP